MLRVFEAFSRRADDPVRRRRRRCVPSLSERASCLEDRVLLSTAGGKAHAAELARNPADTRAGKEIMHVFESVLHTSPTGAQLNQLVPELRDGMSVAALRSNLMAQARMQPGTPVSMNVVINSGDPPASAATARPAAGGGTSSTRIMAGQSASTGPNVRQIPLGTGFTLGFAPTSTGTSGSGSSAGTSTPAPSNPMPPAMSSMPTMTGMSPSSGMPMSTMGSTTITIGSTSIGSTTSASDSTPTNSADIGTPTMLPISPMPVAPFSPTSVTTTGM